MQQPLPQRLLGQQGWPGPPQAWQVRPRCSSSGVSGAAGRSTLTQIAPSPHEGATAQQGCPACPHPVHCPAWQVPPGPFGVAQTLPAAVQRLITQQPPSWQARRPRPAAQQGCPAPPQGRQTRSCGPSPVRSLWQASPAPQAPLQQGWPSPPQGETQVAVA
jgi:hypothetical protein